jgi:hypothetical protein
MKNEDQSNSKVTCMTGRLLYRMLSLLLCHSTLLQVYCMHGFKLYILYTGIVTGWMELYADLSTMSSWAFEI